MYFLLWMLKSRQKRSALQPQLIDSVVPSGFKIAKFRTNVNEALQTQVKFDKMSSERSDNSYQFGIIIQCAQTENR